MKLIKMLIKNTINVLPFVILAGFILHKFGYIVNFTLKKEHILPAFAIALTLNAIWLTIDELKDRNKK